MTQGGPMAKGFATQSILRASESGVDCWDGMTLLSPPVRMELDPYKEI